MVTIIMENFSISLFDSTTCHFIQVMLVSFGLLYLHFIKFPFIFVECIFCEIELQNYAQTHSSYRLKIYCGSFKICESINTDCNTNI